MSRIELRIEDCEERRLPHVWSNVWVKDREHPYWHQHCLRCRQIRLPSLLTEKVLEDMFNM